MPYASREEKNLNAARYRAENHEAIHKSNAEWRARNVEKIREDNMKWRAEHREEEKEKKAKLYRNNREIVLEKAREQYKENPGIWKKRSATYRANNPEKARISIMNWHKRHPEKKAEYEDKRRAKKANVSVNDFTGIQWSTMKLSYEYRCIYCNRRMQRLTKDHVIPIARHGDHTASNIVPCCQSCNSKKKDGPVLPIEYRFSPMTECA